MERKSVHQQAFTGDEVLARAIPAERVKRPDWRPAQDVRGLNGGATITTGDANAPAVAWVEHRQFPGLTFKVEYDRRGQVVGAQVRPLLFKRVVSRSTDGWTYERYEVDEDSISEHENIDLTARLMGNLPWGAVFRQAHGVIRGSFKWLPAEPEWSKVLRSTYRPGSRGRPDRFYAELAADYLAAIEAGQTAKGFAAARHQAPSTINNLLGEAQRRGILARHRGRAGGQLLDYGRSLLAERTEDQ